MVDALIATVFAPVCLSCARVLDAPTRSPVCDIVLGAHRALRQPRVRSRPAIHDAVARTRGRPLRGGPPRRRPRPEVPGPSNPRDPAGSAAARRRRRTARRRGCRRAGAAPSLAPVASELQSGRPCLRRRSAVPCGTCFVAGARRPRKQRWTATQRQANVRDAFAMGGWLPGAADRARRQVEGRTLMLVDDVLTTGATLEACARVLVEAGAREVRAVAVARA